MSSLFGTIRLNICWSERKNCVLSDRIVGKTVLDSVIHALLHADPVLLYGLVAVILLLESSGVPIVNTTLLLFVGALASMDHLNIWLLSFAAITGSVTGACSAYKIGEVGGRNLLFRVSAFFRVDREKVYMTERWFHKSGTWMIFFSRMTPYVRPFACFPAGITRMPFPRFFISALAGSVIWCPSILLIGWTLGKRWRLALILVKDYTLPTIVAFILLIALYCFVTTLGRRLLQAKLQSTRTRASADHETTARSGDLLEV